ncbi:MAG: cupin domain-containing protein [Saprospiraceae bacterium]|nr:cupin domain-containing protein [Saprospiraceae bacterium]
MEKIITRLQHLMNEVPRQLGQFAPDEMSLRPAANKWSKREILGHLCDSALHNWQRFNLAWQASEPLQIARYQQDALVQQNNWQGQPTGQVVGLWASLNTQILAVLKKLPKEKLAHPLVLPDGSAATLQFLIEDYLEHLEHHLGQIFTQKTNPPVLPDRWQISTSEALEILSKHPDGKPFITLLERGRMYVEVYKPQEIDLQKPHDQDEIYVVISGTGLFFNNGELRPFCPGDLIFVPAGVEHRFEGFTEDFATWVIFY